jgi:hypothetical protein
MSITVTLMSSVHQWHNGLVAAIQTLLICSLHYHLRELHKASLFKADYVQLKGKITLMNPVSTIVGTGETTYPKSGMFTVKSMIRHDIFRLVDNVSFEGVASSCAKSTLNYSEQGHLHCAQTIGTNTFQNTIHHVAEPRRKRNSDPMRGGGRKYSSSSEPSKPRHLGRYT